MNSEIENLAQLAIALSGDKQDKRQPKKRIKLTPAEFELIRPYITNDQYWTLVKAGLI